MCFVCPEFRIVLHIDVLFLHLLLSYFHTNKACALKLIRIRNNLPSQNFALRSKSSKPYIRIKISV